MIGEEKLFAYLDGELGPQDRAEIERELVADPALRAELERQRRLRDTLAARFDPVLEEEVPDRLAAMLQPSNVVDLGAVRERRTARFAWPQLTAMAASLAVGILAGQLVLSPESGPVAVEGGALLARGELAETLETRLASAQTGNLTHRVGLTFKDQGGRLCRTFEAPAIGGIACREGEGWAVVMAAAAPASSAAEYRQAASPLVVEQALAMMAGQPFDAEAERRARARGWRPD